ncbi:MAG: hypothetical protein HC897_01000, partial [Thermoanaerobaculia bacterium]|nr:hypothetical protein [Thermoanaerobaculia bacterium]
LARHLRERTNACLPARERERYLGETHERAQKRYEDCETSFGRQAAPHEDG